MYFITCLCHFLAASAHAWAEVCHHTAAEICRWQPLIYGQLTQALTTLEVLAEESLTQASFQTLSQPFSGWMTKPALPVQRPEVSIATSPGRRRNGLATSASSNCIRMLRHGNCNISLQQTSARDTCNFSSCENGVSCSWKQLFAVRSTTEVK